MTSLWLIHDCLLRASNILAELQTWLPASHLLSSAAHWQKDNEFQLSMDQSHVTGMSRLWSFWLLACCKILLCDYDPFIVSVVEGFRSFRALLCEWDLFKLGVRSLANASRARQFNDLNPLGWGRYRFLKQIWQPWSVVRGGRAWSCAAVVRGRAQSCVVVRGRSCTRGRARSVVRGRARSCVVVNHCRSAASRPALHWLETTHRLTDAQHTP